MERSSRQSRKETTIPAEISVEAGLNIVASWHLTSGSAYPTAAAMHRNETSVKNTSMSMTVIVIGLLIHLSVIAVLTI